MWVKLYDGKVWVPAKLSTDLARMYSNGNLENFDVVYILKTRGNPYIGHGEIEVINTHFICFVDLSITDFRLMFMCILGEGS